jgi:hypothetical protein
MTAARVRGIHVHLQHMEVTAQLTGQQVARDATVSRIQHPQLATLKAILQRRQVQAMPGKYRVGLVPLQQLTGTLFNCRQHAEFVGVRDAWLRTS